MERARLGREKASLEAQIRREARAGNQAALGPLAKQLVQLRAQESRLLGMSSQMKSMQYQMSVCVHLS